MDGKGPVWFMSTYFWVWGGQVLIGEEPDAGLENLMEVEIPEYIEQKLKDLDAKEQEQIEKEQRAAESGNWEASKLKSRNAGTMKVQQDGHQTHISHTSPSPNESVL